MSRLGLEINDAALLAVLDTGAGREVISQGPGYALLRGRELTTGQAAERCARMHPRHVQSRFWHDLDTEPLGRPFPREWTAADLAHAQLEEIWRQARPAPERVGLAISSVFSERQLGVVLGIVRALEIPVLGFVDSAVAALSTWPRTGSVIHLDLHLHRLIASELTVGEEVVRDRVKVLSDFGLERLLELWARRVADRLVRVTRFDPLHAAESEQSLYHGIGGWLKEAQTEGVATVRFEAGGAEHQAELSCDELLAAVEPAYAQILDLAEGLLHPGRGSTVALSPTLAALPGIVDLLACRAREVVRLAPEAAAVGALRLGSGTAAVSDLVRFATRLPVEEGAGAPLWTAG